MTDTLSERERELVSAINAYFEEKGDPDRSDSVRTLKRLKDAISAYDPKPSPIPIIPAWEEFVKGPKVFRHREAVLIDIGSKSAVEIQKIEYEAIRQATAKVPTE
jgi:hypothetical protein